MKNLIAIAALVLAGSAFAGEYTNYSRVLFQSASTWVPANKVCQANGFLYHKTKDSIPSYECTGSNDSSCTVVGYKPLVQPMNSAKDVCVEFRSDRCVAYAPTAFDQTTYTVSVYSSYSAFDKNSTPKSQATYAFPACKGTGEVIAY